MLPSLLYYYNYTSVVVVVTALHYGLFGVPKHSMNVHSLFSSGFLSKLHIHIEYRRFRYTHLRVHCTECCVMYIFPPKVKIRN